MLSPVEMVELWRGPFRESVHSGHAVICGLGGQIVQAWGNPDQVILPRSSTKMIQALPLIESGAAKAFGLTQEQLAFACASHEGAALHSQMATDWLTSLGLGDKDLLCGPEAPRDREAKFAMIRAYEKPCHIHHNCSGKHCGFLTLGQHLNAGPEYVAPDHPVQQAVRDAFEHVTGMESPGFGVDGCSAPNFATTVHGLARAMAYFASAGAGDGRSRAAAALRDAITAHPVHVAGEGRACTRLMRACAGRAAVKTGAEGVFTAIVPEKGLGIAVKIVDGTTRASESAIAGLLVQAGALDPAHPDARRYLDAPLKNARGTQIGRMRSLLA